MAAFEAFIPLGSSILAVGTRLVQMHDGLILSRPSKTTVNTALKGETVANTKHKKQLFLGLRLPSRFSDLPMSLWHTPAELEKPKVRNEFSRLCVAFSS